MSCRLVIVSAAATHCSEKSRARGWWWKKTEDPVESNTRDQWRTTLSRSRFGWFFALVCLAYPLDAVAGYSSLYIFGDSLSDSGNNAVVLAPNVTSIPISGTALSPLIPMLRGGIPTIKFGLKRSLPHSASTPTPRFSEELTTPLAERRPGRSLLMPFQVDCSTLFLPASRPKQHSFCPNTNPLIISAADRAYPRPANSATRHIRTGCCPGRYLLSRSTASPSGNPHSLS